jgi:hypothetical protein
MTQPKSISDTLKNLLSYPVVERILNRSSNIYDSIATVKEYWGYDLLKRKPSPAYDDYDVFTGTDLDLACFLYELSGRGAVINIPIYKALRQARVKEGEKITSKYNRHGQLMGVTANKDFFTFSISILDQNVVGADKVGEYRNFAMTDFNGDFYPGWSEIQFVPTLNENKFITESKLWSGNKIFFKNFIHPNRWTSFFGYHYVITKLLISRLEEESKHYYGQMKKILNAGFKYPGDSGPGMFPSKPEGDKKSMKFKSFQAQVFIPEAEYTGLYPELNKTQKNLVMAYEHRKELTYKIIPKLRFMVRATEYAHFIAQDRFPAWMKNTKWEEGFVIPGGRTKWDRVKLFQTKPGEFSVSLLRRTYDKSTQVDADY